MATFDPRMPEVRPHISVTEGVTDPTANNILKAAWGVGKAAWQGMAQADLVGAEQHVDDVVSDDIYGAFELDAAGEPARVAFETDLTKISNARRQRKITPDRAKALVNMRLRKAVNDNPIFSEELTNRAERFFGNVLGGGNGGDIFAPTAQEVAETKYQERVTNALIDEELLAAKEGYESVEHRRRVMRMQVENAQMEEQLKASRGLNLQEVIKGVNATRTNAELRIFGSLAALQQERGGLLDQESRLAISNHIEREKQMLENSIFEHRPYIDGAEADRLVSSTDSWAESLNKLATSGNLEEFTAMAKDQWQNMSYLQMANDSPMLVGLAAVSPGLAEIYMNWRAQPEKSALVSRLDGEFAWVGEYMGRMEDPGATWGPMLGNALRRIGGEEPNLPVDGPMGGIQEEVDAAVAAEGVAGMIDQLTPEERQRSLDILGRNAADTPAVLTSLLTNRAKAWVNSNPNVFKQSEAMLGTAMRSTELDIAQQGIDMSMFTIREATDRERALANSPRGQARGSGRHLGRTGLIIEPSEEARREYARSRSRRIHERGSPVEPMPDVFSFARDLQDIINVAQTYPSMEIKGQPAMQYIQNMLRGTSGAEESSSLLDNVISPAGATFGDTMIEPGSIADQDRRSRIEVPEIPWMREQQVQDVEFDDFQVAGEEGSMVGGLNVELTKGLPKTRRVAITQVYRHLARKEGVGDNVTDVPTGNMGVTASARRAVGADDSVPDHEVAQMYLAHLDGVFSRAFPNYNEAPTGVQSVLLDAAYNMGEGVAQFRGVRAAMEDSDWEKVGLNLLDTANVGGQTMRGLASRRAESYNLLGGTQIEWVEQDKDGTIRYLDKDENVVFEYNTPKGRHPKSAARRSRVEDGDTPSVADAAQSFVGALEALSKVRF